MKPGSDDHRKFYAQFANASYGDGTSPYADWHLDPTYSNRNRKLYVNHDKKEAVYSFRGTNPKNRSDLATDVQLALGLEHYNSRFRNGHKWTNRVAQAYPDYKLTLTGHSAGASVAQYVGKKTKHEAVTYSAHLPTTQIQREAIGTLLGTSKSNAHNYTTIMDPVGVGMALAGKSHVVPQKSRSPHSMQNFLL